MSKRSDRPNVLFIISDQHQQAAAGCYGHPLVRTPNLDRLAGDGVRFDNAYCQSPLCGPSRASVLTGRQCSTVRYYTHGQADPLADVPTLGSVFRSAGYATGAIGKVHVRGEGKPPAGPDLGFDDRRLRIYTRFFEDYVELVGKDVADKYATYRTQLADYTSTYNKRNVGIDIPEEQMYDALVTERCIDFLEKRAAADEPFFLWAGFDKPHPDWFAPEEYHRMYDPADVELPATFRERRDDIPEIWRGSLRQDHFFTDDEARHAIAAYYANVTYTDVKVGQLLDALDRLGLSDNTIIVYTTDHGESLLEHGMIQKHCFFESAVRVPLLLTAPAGVPRGVAREGIVSLVDLFPTLCDLTGLDAPEGLDGISLLDDIAGAPAPAERAAFCEFYEWGAPERMIRTPRWKYMYCGHDTDQMYDLINDPLEQTNLVNDPAHAATARDLRARILHHWAQPDMQQVNHGGPWHRPKAAIPPKKAE